MEARASSGFYRGLLKLLGMLIAFGSQGPATPSVFAFAASKRNAMLLHLPYSIVVTTPDAYWGRGPVLGDAKKKRERGRVLVWPGLQVYSVLLA